MSAPKAKLPEKVSDWFAPKAADAPGFAALGAKLAAAGQNAEAAHAFECAVAAAPKEGRYHAALGVAWQRAGQPVEARAAYEQSFALGVDDIDVWVNLGEVAFELGDFAAATTAFERAAQIEPGKAHPAKRRARALALKIAGSMK